jgi:hypothetical protein
VAEMRTRLDMAGRGAGQGPAVASLRSSMREFTGPCALREPMTAPDLPAAGRHTRDANAAWNGVVLCRRVR